MGTIIGLDPSLSNTGIVAGDETGAFDVTALSSLPCDNSSVIARVDRYTNLAKQVVYWIGRREVVGIYVEGYSYGSNDANAKFSTEYGGILRLHLSHLTNNIREVPPLTLKKFITGKGAGKKELVIAHIAKKYGHIFNSNDEYDAFSLFRFGLAAEKLVEMENEAQRQAVAKVMGVKEPKKSRRKKAVEL